MALADGPQEERPPVVEQARPNRLLVLVDQVERGVGQLERPAVLARAVRGVGSEQQDVDRADPGERLGIRHVPPHLEHLLEVSQRVGVGVDRRGRLGRPEARRDRLLRPAGRVPVVGELRGRLAAARR